MHFHMKLLQLHAICDTILDMFIACWYDDDRMV